MFGLRNIARSAPRSTVRLSRAIRPQASLFRPAAAALPAWTRAAPRLTASFHISAIQKQDTEVKEELLSKLVSEISMEEGQRDDEDLSNNIKEYLENSPFAIDDKPGHQEVTLTRTFGDEKITVTFSTADLNNPTNEDSNDAAMFDNDVDDIVEGQSGGAHTKGAINQGNTQDGNLRVARENGAAPADREELDDEYDEEAPQQGFPAHVVIRIERPDRGALHIDATAQDGDILIEDMLYFPSSDVAEPESAEKNWARRTLYTGPPFNNLDEDLQVMLEKYLEERGINTRMSLFIPDYIDFKEQKEYVRWLTNLAKFIN